MVTVTFHSQQRFRPFWLHSLTFPHLFTPTRHLLPLLTYPPSPHLSEIFPERFVGKSLVLTGRGKESKYCHVADTKTGQQSSEIGTVSKDWKRIQWGIVLAVVKSVLVVGSTNFDLSLSQMTMEISRWSM